MQSMKYTDEKHAQILLALLKEHGIKKVVASPGTTNMPIIGSVQNDPYFTVFSSVDERSAAYLACGIAEESGEVVVLSCTGATASRNYMPGLTEAFYRKLPIIAITSFNGNQYIGNLVPQNIDRTVIPNDVAKLSVQLPVVKDDDDEWLCNVLCNKAILEATRNGKGPVHINLTSVYGTYTTKELPPQRVIKRYTVDDDLPNLDSTKIAIFIGAHKKFTQSETQAIDEFCNKYQAFVACDHTSSYNGSYRILTSLACINFTKSNSGWDEIKPEIVIHLGEISGDYPSTKILETAKHVWRVSEDGEVRDRTKHLKVVYQGTEESFFKKLSAKSQKNVSNEYFKKWFSIDSELRQNIPEIPFSNPWIAQTISESIPQNSSIFFGILNSLRSWNYFQLPSGIRSSSNVGGFGIDGCLSTAMGASFVNPDKLYFVILGDLAFFYDVNVIANRHVGNNIRILLINNGCGVEFNLSSHIASTFEGDRNELIAAGGHFASGENHLCKVATASERVNKSLARSWSETLGFTYMKAETKEEFIAGSKAFLDNSISRPIVFECFTTEDDESNSHELVASSLNLSMSDQMKVKAKEILPSGIKKFAKKLLK